MRLGSDRLLAALLSFLVVGGVAHAQDYPHRVIQSLHDVCSARRLAPVGSDKTFCNGVVIARELILTAAQCVHPHIRPSSIRGIAYQQDFAEDTNCLTFCKSLVWLPSSLSVFVFESTPAG